MCYNNQGINFSYIKCHKSIATIFPLSILPMTLPQIYLFFNSFPRFRQLGCHNAYFLSPPFPTISATWLPELVSLWALHLVLALGHFTLTWAAASGSKNFGNLITEIQFFLPPPSHYLSLLSLSHTFYCNFSNTIAEIHSLFSFFQIALNNTYITNKLNFSQ